VLHWQSCDGGFQCATAQVPLDYQDPDGAMISIAVIRHTATDPAQHIGSLFFDGGGPTELIDGFPANYAQRRVLRNGGIHRQRPEPRRGPRRQR
jgi:hypothetical protein